MVQARRSVWNFSHGLRGRGVEGVGRQAGSRHHRDHLVEQVRAVLGERLGRCPAAAVFSETSSWRRLASARKSASRIVHMSSHSLISDRDGHRSGHGAQHEAEAEAEDVQDHDVLELERVGEVEDQVRGGAGREGRPSRSERRRRGRAEHRGERRAPPATESAPLAMGRRRFAGAGGPARGRRRRSAGRRRRTGRRRGRKRAAARASGSGSKRCFENASAANTTRFFVHWWGAARARRPWRRRGSEARDAAVPPRSAAPRPRALEALDGLVFGVVGLEDREELGDREQVPGSSW